MSRATGQLVISTPDLYFQEWTWINNQNAVQIDPDQKEKYPDNAIFYTCTNNLNEALTHNKVEFDVMNNAEDEINVFEQLTALRPNFDWKKKWEWRQLRELFEDADYKRSASKASGTTWQYARNIVITDGKYCNKLQIYIENL